MPDALLAQMSRAARDDVLADPRWAAFAAGTLDVAERAALLDRARAAGLDDATIEAFGPRDAAFEDRLVEAALAARTGERTGRAAPVRTLPRRSRVRVYAGGAFVLAAAAVVLLWWLRRSKMPEYAMFIEGGVQVRRSSSGEAGEGVKVVPGNRVVITLQPAERVTWEIAARLHVIGPGPAPEPRASIEVAESGAVRVVASAEDLFGSAPAGLRDVCVSVGEPASLPAVAVTERPPAAGRGFVTVCRAVEWAGAP